MGSHVFSGIRNVDTVKKLRHRFVNLDATLHLRIVGRKLTYTCHHADGGT